MGDCRLELNYQHAVISKNGYYIDRYLCIHLYELMDNVLKSEPLKNFGVKESDLPVFAGDVIKTQQRLLKNNYITLSEAEILDIYKAAF